MKIFFDIFKSSKVSLKTPHSHHLLLLLPCQCCTSRVLSSRFTPKPFTSISCKWYDTYSRAQITFSNVNLPPLTSSLCARASSQHHTFPFNAQARFSLLLCGFWGLILSCTILRIKADMAGRLHRKFSFATIFYQSFFFLTPRGDIEGDESSTSNIMFISLSLLNVHCVKDTVLIWWFDVFLVCCCCHARTHLCSCSPVCRVIEFRGAFELDIMWELKM